MEIKNYANHPEIPLGLGMALAQNLDAMNYFSSLSGDMKKKIIDHTHAIKSKKEMQAYVDSFVGKKFN